MSAFCLSYVGSMSVECQYNVGFMSVLCQYSVCFEQYNTLNINNITYK